MCDYVVKFFACRTICALTVLLVSAGCAKSPSPGDSSVAQAAVAMPDEYSAQASLAVLKDGGNAIDAAIAASFVLAVTYPEAGNLGGGGFMLVHHHDGDAFLDYREVAPGAASADMYLDEGGEPIENLSLVGHRAAGVPGTVAGMWAAHQRYGSQPWETLLAPAIELAENGFIVSEKLAKIFDATRDRYAGKANIERYFSGLRTGERFIQVELAATLRRLAKTGSEDFYSGETAQLLISEMQRNKGLIDAEDLASYQVVWRKPLRANWRGKTLLSSPPPSSGGFAVVQLLKMKDILAEDFAGLAHNSAPYVHLIAEMEKRVFADRAEYFGDPDFVDVPISRLLEDDYIVERAAAVDARKISDVAGVRPGLESPDTTHFSIVDFDGNAVANTYTLNTAFGSGVVVEGGGFLLNNEMDDFSTKPDTPNFYGVVGGGANAIAPGKRMLSSMSPTIVLNNNQAELVLGTPGGSTIFTSVFQGVVNIYDFGMSAAESASASRFHHQLLPSDLVTFSRSVPLSPEVVSRLGEFGYNARPHPWEFGDLQIIYRDADKLTAGSDSRGRGVARVIDATALAPE